MKKLRVLSLFDGISTGRLALESLGIPVEYYTSEIDENAIAISDYHYSDNIKLGNVTNIDFKSLGKIDLLIGGSPCTSFSICGKRDGFEGESKLFWEYVRALKECQPKYFFLENVESMDAEAMEIISKEMGCYPYFLNSSIVSAQWRKRYYWFNFGKKKVKLLGLPTCYVPTPTDKHLVLADILETPISVEREHIVHDKPVRLSEYEKSKGQAQRVYSMWGKSVCLNANGGGQGGKTGLYKIDTKDGYEIRKPTPIEAERLQCLPDDWTKFGIKNGKQVEITPTNRYKAVGNGWTTDVITHIFQYLKMSLEQEDKIKS